MYKIISFAQNLHHTNKNVYKQNIKMWIKQLFVLAFFIIFSKVLRFKFEQSTIYLLGVVSVIATCANYGQSILERKNLGIYQYILGIGYSYNVLLGIEVIDFWLVNFKNIIFLIVSNSIFWFVIRQEILFKFLFSYGMLVILESVILSILIIQSSIYNKNAPYWMSFSIFIVIIVLMLFSLAIGIQIISLTWIILNIIYFVLLRKTKNGIYII